MNLFFDTSALVKYFHDEPGTEYVTTLIEDADHTVWCSELARIEFVSAVHRKFREGVLDEEQLGQALDGFADATRSFYVEPLGQPVTEEAEQLLQKHGRIHMPCAHWMPSILLRIRSSPNRSGDSWWPMAASTTWLGKSNMQ